MSMTPDKPRNSGRLQVERASDGREFCSEEQTFGDMEAVSAFPMYSAPHNVCLSLRTVARLFDPLCEGLARSVAAVEVDSAQDRVRVLRETVLHLSGLLEGVQRRDTVVMVTAEVSEVQDAVSMRLSRQYQHTNTYPVKKIVVGYTFCESTLWRGEMVRM